MPWPDGVWFTAVIAPGWDPREPIRHVVRKGRRSYCGAVSLHRGGWLVLPSVVASVDHLPVGAVCIECLRRMRSA